VGPSSRTELLDFAEKHQIPIAKDKRGEAPFSVDANLLHSSSEGKVLEDPAVEPPPYVYQRTVSPMEAPDTPTEIEIGFREGRRGLDQRQGAVPATLLAGSTNWAATMASAASTWSRTASSA
jgi:argininosuccinate synthase